MLSNHLSLLHFTQQIRSPSLERRVHVRPCIRPLDNLPITIQVQLPPERTEFIVSEILSNGKVRKHRGNKQPSDQKRTKGKQQKMKPQQKRLMLMNEKTRGSASHIMFALKSHETGLPCSDKLISYLVYSEFVDRGNRTLFEEFTRYSLYNIYIYKYTRIFSASGCCALCRCFKSIMQRDIT